MLANHLKEAVFAGFILDVDELVVALGNLIAAFSLLHRLNCHSHIPANGLIQRHTVFELRQPDCRK